MPLEGTMQLITQAVRKEGGGGGFKYMKRNSQTQVITRSYLLYLFLLLHNKFIGSEKAK